MLAREKFGYEDFRPGQEAAIQSILAGHDTLAVLPTGMGKSLIYQIATLMLSGPAIIVSPLIALQRDQVESIEELEVGQAAQVNSTIRDAERELVQQQFMDDELEVIVATTAFGMGIDKPNVRFVFHYDISDSLDSYYQEIGRAGRDGEDAKAILFYRSEDLGIRRFFAGSGRIDADQVEQVAKVIQESNGPIVLQDLSEKTHLSRSKLIEALSRLEEIGVIKTLPTGEVVSNGQSFDLDEVAQEAVGAHESRRQFDRSRIEMMCGSAEVRDCRREYLLNYFGEEIDDPCGFCDNCEAGITVEEDEENELFPINTRVLHKTWGEGMVLRYEGDKMVVLFNGVGYKTLAVGIVKDKRLLEQSL